MGDTQENWVTPKIAQTTSLNSILSWRRKKDAGAVRVGDVAGGKEGQFQEVTRKSTVSKGTVVMQI